MAELKDGRRGKLAGNCRRRHHALPWLTRDRRAHGRNTARRRQQELSRARIA